MAVLGLFDRQFMAVRRGGNGIESRVERPGFLEIGAPARKRNEGAQGDSVAARGQYVGKQPAAEKRPPNFRYLLLRQSRHAAPGTDTQRQRKRCVKSWRYRGTPY